MAIYLPLVLKEATVFRWNSSRGNNPILLCTPPHVPAPCSRSNYLGLFVLFFRHELPRSQAPFCRSISSSIKFSLQISLLQLIYIYIFLFTFGISIGRKNFFSPYGDKSKDTCAGDYGSIFLVVRYSKVLRLNKLKNMFTL